MQQKINNQKKKATPFVFSTMSIKQRFDTVKMNDIVYAPHSWGSPAMLYSVHQETFQKTTEEKIQLANAKKAHNKFLFDTFGSKRVTAGVLRRYYLNM